MTESRIQPLTLRFDEPLESEFLDRYHEQSIRLMRIGLTIGFLLYASFGFLDVVAVPTKLEEVWFIRYGIACPALLLLLFWSFHHSFRRFSQLGLLIAGVVGSVTIIAMTVIAPEPTNHLYQSGVMAAMMFVPSAMRQRFVYALWTSIIVIVIYNIVALVEGSTPAWIIVNHNFFLFTAMVLGGFASYGLEHYARRNFLQSRTIEKKNEELSVANRELLESRQVIIESSRRAQLIFSALADALPGTTLDDKYEIGDKIGSGGFGTVYRGRHLLLDAPVAIKIFRPTDTKNLEKSFERFRIEGVSAKRIKHPNAVEVLDFGISGSALAFLVMELLDGRSLAEEMQVHGRLPAQRCAEIIVPLCSVLAEAHAVGIIHRDIKPGNVFLHKGKQGEVVKVVDFGIAKLTEDRPQNFDQLTATGAVIGTPSYMAPERLEFASYGVRSDIYSVGVLWYEMLTGRLPFEAKVEAMWRAMILESGLPVPSPKDQGADIPDAVEQLILRALASNPDERPSATEIAREVSRLYDLPLPGERQSSREIPSPAVPISRPPSARENEPATFIDLRRTTEDGSKAKNARATPDPREA